MQDAALESVTQVSRQWHCGKAVQVSSITCGVHTQYTLGEAAAHSARSVIAGLMGSSAHQEAQALGGKADERVVGFPHGRHWRARQRAAEALTADAAACILHTRWCDGR